MSYHDQIQAVLGSHSENCAKLGGCASEAIADAETFWNVHNSYAGLTECWRGTDWDPCCTHKDARAWGEIVRIVIVSGHAAYGEAKEAARNAFLTVPELRG